MVLQLHNDGSIFQYTGTPFSWQQLDNNPATTAIVAAFGVPGPFILRNGSGIFQYTGTPFAWQQIDNNPATTALATSIIGPGFGLYELHNDGSGIWQFAGALEWQQIDNNPSTIAIVAAPLNAGDDAALYQLRNDGGIFQNDVSTPSSGWQRLDINPANVAIAAGGALYQQHNDGSIFQ